MIGLNKAAIELGMSDSGLRKLVKRGEICYMQHGRGRIRFRPEWLHDYISKHTHFGPVPVTVKKQKKPSIPCGGALGFNWSLASL